MVLRPVIIMVDKNLAPDLSKRDVGLVASALMKAAVRCVRYRRCTACHIGVAPTTPPFDVTLQKTRHRSDMKRRSEHDDPTLSRVSTVDHWQAAFVTST